MKSKISKASLIKVGEERSRGVWEMSKIWLGVEDGAGFGHMTVCRLALSALADCDSGGLPSVILKGLET